MTGTGAVTAAEPWNAYKISFEHSSDPAFFPSGVFFIKNLNNFDERQKVINMPVDLFLAPEVSLYPLLKSIERRANVRITSFLEMEQPLLSYRNRGVFGKCHHQHIGAFHQKDITIGSYKTDSVPSSYDTA
jgi:hypothetical protein